MGTCMKCGGYASAGKELCPFDQIRHGELKNGKWIVWPMRKVLPDEAGISKDLFGAETITVGLQQEFIGLNGDYSNSSEDMEDE